MEWWKSFFDEDYVNIWANANPKEQSEREAQLLVELLGLEPGAKLLDAPCGYGRTSVALAGLGLEVTGIDYSRTMLDRAEQAAHEAGVAARFLRADLREPLDIEGFAAAVNLFSSIGYGSEDDDERMLRNIGESLVPGGLLFLDTMHRDAYCARRARGESSGLRGPNGLTLKETFEFDPIEGRIHSHWTWNSPTMSGSKRLEMRLYCPTELVALLRRAGFEPVSYHQGISHEVFGDESWDQRLGILCTRTCDSSRSSV